MLGPLGVGRSAHALDPLAALRAGQFDDADAATADYADPVARKLILYYRLLKPGAASPGEIAAFLADNPAWPGHAQLKHSWQEAIAHEPDDVAAGAACDGGDVSLPAALARCAQAFAARGDSEAAATAARRAWVEGFADPSPDQTAFLAQWKSVLRPQDELARFDRLAWARSPQASAQIARLAAPERAAARVRLALQQDAPTAFDALQKLPEAERDSPALVLDTARWLRHAGREPEALALWHSQGEAAEHAAPPERLGAFWVERNALARRLLTLGDAKGAYFLANDETQPSGQAAASVAFLSGFIALRRAGDPNAAAIQFGKLAAQGKSAITQARAHYWLARVAAATGQDPGPEYRLAAAYPLTFYGQLAARATGADDAALAARIRDLTDPSAGVQAAWSFAGGELVRAASILVAWGEFGHARAFLLRAQENAGTEPVPQVLAGRLALAFGLPDAAVSIARRMGAQGLALPQAGWPEPVHPPPAPPDPAVTLALIRQESSFDSGIVSPAGARGLMQLMPGTADREARQAGGSITEAALTSDPARNMELGAAYMREMLSRFGGSLPLAVAAYNAGPKRVEQWLHDNGDPRTGQVDMIDWIELIPFEETRNYVQRVLESVVIYQARRNEPPGTLTAQWMR